VRATVTPALALYSTSTTSTRTRWF
jgi:hypothetical protein